MSLNNLMFYVISKILHLSIEMEYTFFTRFSWNIYFQAYTAFKYFLHLIFSYIYICIWTKTNQVINIILSPSEIVSELDFLLILLACSYLFRKG